MAVQLAPGTPAASRGALDDDRVERLFEEWWLLYPRKRDKGHARLAYRRALGKATPEVLLAGLRRYAREVSRDDRAPGDRARYVKHPSTWLNGECWGDEAEVPPPEGRSGGRSARYVVERVLFPGRGVAFARHFLSYVVAPAERLRLAGAEDRGELASSLGRLYLWVEAERRAARFADADYAALMGDSELLRHYVGWLAGQGWGTASLAVLAFDSPAFSHFRREFAGAEQYGRDPVTRRSRFAD